MKKNIGVFIGRCQPFHDGHRAIIRRMMAECNESVILLGSVNKCGTIKNPYTYHERRDKILSEFSNVKIYPINDYLYRDDLWLEEVCVLLDKKYANDNITIYAHMKPDNEYLKWFPEYKYVEVYSGSDDNGTKIRESLFSKGKMPDDVQEEWDFYKKEKKLFANYPFKETLQFNCSDAIVHNIDDNEILLIKRKNAPGKNKWALPGGFKNNDETFYECAIRELKEETGIDIINTNGFMVEGVYLFDSPLRKDGGILRNTNCYYFTASQDTLDSINLKAADDAVDLDWFSVSEIMDEIDMFHDHRDIISQMIGVYPEYARNNPKYK